MGERTRIWCSTISGGSPIVAFGDASAALSRKRSCLECAFASGQNYISTKDQGEDVPHGA